MYIADIKCVNNNSNEELSSETKYSKTPQTRTYFSKKQTDWVLTNEVLMKFSGCGSYRKDTCYYDEYKAIQCVLNKLEGRMTAFKY